MQSVINEHLTKTHMISGFYMYNIRFVVLHIIQIAQIVLVIFYNLDNAKRYSVCQFITINYK